MFGSSLHHSIGETATTLRRNFVATYLAVEGVKNANLMDCCTLEVESFSPTLGSLVEDLTSRASTRGPRVTPLETRFRIERRGSDATALCSFALSFTTFIGQSAS